MARCDQTCRVTSNRSPTRLRISNVLAHAHKKVEIEQHSQFGEADYSFTRQVEHFVAIWRNV